MDPARMFKESLTSRPELENSQGQNRTFVAGFLRNARHAERSNGRCSVLRHWAGPRSAASARDRRHDRGATRHNLRSGS